MEIPKRDGDGYLVDMSDWTEDIGRAMAESDQFELTDKKWEQILKAREYFEEFGAYVLCGAFDFVEPRKMAALVELNLWKSRKIKVARLLEEDLFLAERDIE